MSQLPPIEPIFNSAFSKAQWASHHIRSLTGGLALYVKDNIRVAIEQPDGPEGEQIVKIVSDEFWVPIPLLVGDIVRNLRDSLDHFVSAVFLERIGNNERIVFPVATDSQNLGGVIRSTFNDPRVVEIGETILNKIQPTQAFGSPIWAFNQINNADKHRQLVITVNLVSTPMADWNRGGTSFYRNTIIAEPGENFGYRIPTGAEIMNDAHLKPTLRISFGPSEVFAGEGVVPTLIDCSKATFAALQELLKTYRSTMPAP